MSIILLGLIILAVIYVFFKQKMGLTKYDECLKLKKTRLSLIYPY